MRSVDLFSNFDAHVFDRAATIHFSRFFLLVPEWTTHLQYIPPALISHQYCTNQDPFSTMTDLTKANLAHRRKQNFENSKNQCLGKRDKSFAGRIDPKARAICGLINDKEEFYTTSSCGDDVFSIKEKESRPRPPFDAFAFLTIPSKTAKDILI